MEFNPSKCVVIHVTMSRAPIPSQYLLNGQVLESVAGSKYLGVEISSNLLFQHPHSEHNYFNSKSVTWLPQEKH